MSKLIEKMLEENKKALEIDRETLERMNITERFFRRKSFAVKGGDAEVQLGRIQKEVRNMENKIKFNEEFSKFLEEIKDEK